MSEENKEQKSGDDRPQRSEGGKPEGREGGGGGGREGGGGGGREGGGGGHRRGGGGRRYKRKFCRFCANPDWDIDYKNIELMQRFVTNRGKILPRRVTGTCAKHQRKLATAIKQARVLNLMPFKVR